MICVLRLINGNIFLYRNTGNSLHLTTTSNSDPFAQVILVEDPRNPPLNSDINGYWFIDCDNNPDIWGLDIKLDGDKYGFTNTNDSQIEILMDIYNTSGKLDILTAFSVNDKYFANTKQGIYPSCGSSLIYQPNLLNVFEIYNQSLGNTSNKTNDAEGLHIFSITNDAINNKVYFQFNSPTMEYSCIFDDSFDLYSDIHFYFRNNYNEDDEQSKIYSVDIINRYCIILYFVI